MNNNKIIQFEDLVRKFEEFQLVCRAVLPTVSWKLIEDLILHQQENPGLEYMYKIEIFTTKETSVNKFKQVILEKTGMIPEVYDSGTHYLVNYKLSLETLNEISQSDPNILEIRGEYIGNNGLKEFEHKYK